LLSGETLTIRLYFSCGSTSAGRYAMLKNVIVKGEALTALPTNLLSFNANYVGNAVNLIWKTSNEVNVDAYLIEKSTDGMNFSTIGKLSAFNNNTANYQFWDRSIEAGVVYYRLKMLDKNGIFKFSNIIALNTKKAELLSVYPNPVDEIAVVKHPKANKTAIIDVLSAEGKSVLRIPVQYAALQTTIAVNYLRKGHYIIRYSDAENLITIPFIKQ